VLNAPNFDTYGLTPACQGPLLTWLNLLSEWNKRIDLTAARSDSERFDLMLADAAFVAQYIDHGARVIDVGSGAGAPGLALALMRPDLHVTLVEPLAKRIAFLRTAIGATGRTDISVVREHGQTVAETVHAPFDVAISRATLPPAEWLELGLRLAPRVWVLLAREEPPTSLQAHTSKDAPYTWPATGAQRRAVLYTRVALETGRPT